jgi:hypothetical protein
MLILLANWRKRASFKPFSLAANYTLIGAGLFFFLMQMHGYSHVTHPDEFGFSADNHIHEHIKMDQENAARIRKESGRVTID